MSAPNAPGAPSQQVFTPPVTTPSLANSGYGAVFSVSAASPVSYVPVAEINSITKKNFDVTSIDVTTLTSPNATEEMIPGLMKPGTVEITGNFIGDPTQTQFNTLAQNQTVFYFQMTAPMQRKAKTYTATGNCFVLSYETGPFEPNQKISFKATLQITGFVNEVIA
jgi:hypothetical protein